PRPERIEVYARRTWRSPAVEPQIALAKAHGVEVQTIGVPQPKPQVRPTTVQRALRKARRLVASVVPQRPLGGGDGAVAILGDFTSGADLAARWDEQPGLSPTVELDPTLFGDRPTDGHPE
ncbi:MAG: hypothetical protein Q4G35_08695, partial [Propionibacteriaceae bacterium]|nr:hypothetical protein [Propionibacteriaceae bacterium]